MSLPSNLSTEVASIKRDINYPLYSGDRIIHPDEVLQQRGSGQYKAYDDLRRDGHCKSVLQKRELAVIAREWEVKPGGTSTLDKKAADMVKYHLESLGDRTSDSELGVGGFDSSCLNFLDAILKGFAVGEAMWGGDGKEIYPTEIKPRNQQRFIFGLSDKGSYELRLLTPENSDGEKIGTLYPRKFITHSFGAKDGNPYGMGLGQTLWFPVFFKRQDIKFWLTFVDKFASPTALGKYKQGATEQQKRTLLAALEAIAHDAGVIVPEGMEISLLEASRSGSIECYESLAKYMDSELSKAVLGETLSTDVGDRGSYAASQTHNEVRKEVTKADADLLSDTLNRTLIRWDVELNLPGAKPPKLWRNFEEAEDLNTRVTRDKTLFDMGWKLKKEAVSEIYGDFYEEQQEGGEASDEQFLANSGVEKEPQTQEDTADMSESLDFGSIIDRVLNWQGLDIGVEYLPGQVRFPGRKNSKKLRSGYGHIRGMEGADGEALDCYIYSGLLKDEPEGSDRLFQVSQLSAEDSDFDEHKFMLGYKDVKAAREAYLTEMPVEFFGGITEVTLANLEQYRRKPVSLSASKSLPITSDFAEVELDVADRYSNRLHKQTAPLITNWIGQINHLVEDSQSLEEVRDRILDLYPQLNTQDFAEIMGQAMIASEAAGRWEVLEETFVELREDSIDFYNPNQSRDARGRFGSGGTSSKTKNKHFDKLVEEISQEKIKRYKENGSYKHMDLGNGKQYDDIVASHGKQAADKAFEQYVRKSSIKTAEALNKQAIIKDERASITKGEDEQLKRELIAMDRFYPHLKEQLTLQEFKDKNSDANLLKRLEVEENLDRQLSYDQIMKRGNKHISNLDTKLLKAKTDGERLSTMERYRDELIKAGMPKDEAINLVKTKIFDSSVKSIGRAVTESAAAEFYQITGGYGSSTLNTFKRDTDRAYANKQDKNINIGVFPDKNTIFHEMGHHLEFEDPRIAVAASDWRDKRATGIEQPLNNLITEGKYREDEKARPDAYIHPYVGKVYGDGSTEVISMGIERFHAAKSMLKFYEQDKEHFQFVVGVIRRD